MTDEELVIATRAGDHWAFDRLTERYWTRCRNVAWLYVRNHADAEDVAQKTFLNAFVHIDQCDPEHFRAWIDKITENESKMFNRNRTRRPGRFVRFSRFASTEPSVEEQIRIAEFGHIVRTEVLRLPKHWRGVMWMYRIEERNIADVAKDLGIGVHAAKSRLIWAQLALGARLKKKLKESVFPPGYF